MANDFDKDNFNEEEGRSEHKHADYSKGSKRIIRSRHNERILKDEEKRRIIRERERLNQANRGFDESSPAASSKGKFLTPEDDKTRRDDEFKPRIGKYLKEVNYVPDSYKSRGPGSSEAGDINETHHEHEYVRETEEHRKHADIIKDRNAETPSELSKSGFGAVAKRTYREVSEDNIGIISAGVAFYAFLSIFPLLAAIISIYGLVYSPAAVQSQIAQLAAFLPASVRLFLTDQMARIAGSSSQILGISLIVGILLSLWSANKATKALFTGINIAYEERDERGFFAQNGLTLLFTLGAIVFVFVAMAIVIGAPAFVDNLKAPEPVKLAVYWGRWILLAVMIITSLTLLYKYAAQRNNPKFRWVTWGSVIAAILWLAASIAFSYYAENFGKFNETYGSMAAVVILLLWFMISAFVILLGAEINSELERQTHRDTTVGPDRPMGQRGAEVADHPAS